MEQNYVGILKKNLKKNSKVFKYPHFNKVFVNENPKTGFADMTKTPKRGRKKEEEKLQRNLSKKK